eukprot:5448257-Amphidinium_carterae.1
MALWRMSGTKPHTLVKYFVGMYGEVVCHNFDGYPGSLKFSWKSRSKPHRSGAQMPAESKTTK